VSDIRVPKLGICQTSALPGFGIYAFGIPAENRPGVCAPA
jgi:hypothetical protein